MVACLHNVRNLHGHLVSVPITTQHIHIYINIPPIVNPNNSYYNMQTKVHLPPQYACSHVVVVAICHVSRPVSSQARDACCSGYFGGMARLGTLPPYGKRGKLSCVV